MSDSPQNRRHRLPFDSACKRHSPLGFSSNSINKQFPWFRVFTNGYCHQRTGARFFRKLILLAGLSIISLTSTLAAPDRNDQAENSITESNVRSAGTPGAAEKSDEDFSDDPRHWFRGPDYQSFLQQSPEVHSNGDA